MTAKITRERLPRTREHQEELNRAARRTLFKNAGGAIPRDRILAILEREIEKRDDPELDTRTQSGLEQLAQEVSASTGQTNAAVLRYLYTVRCGIRNERNRKTKELNVHQIRYLKFDQVDKIFQALDLTHLWHNELSDLYYSDLTQLPADL